MVRISKWSWSQGWGRKPEMYQAKCRVAVDFDHDMILRINLQQHRISVTVIKIFEELHNDHMENYFVGPGANVCVKVSTFTCSLTCSLTNLSIILNILSLSLSLSLSLFHGRNNNLSMLFPQKKITFSLSS